jgi:23S rRNA-/tRNA-specific pseudouridylate synthase
VPILFDPLYGGAVASLPGAPCARLALHAERLVLRQGALELVAPLPADLAALQAWLDEGR